LTANTLLKVTKLNNTGHKVTSALHVTIIHFTEMTTSDQSPIVRSVYQMRIKLPQINDIVPNFPNKIHKNIQQYC